MSDTPAANLFLAPIGESIWDLKYRLKDSKDEPIDLTVQDTWTRIADALSKAEKTTKDQVKWATEFYKVLSSFRFLPAGRIVAGAGAGRNVTLSNCYVMGTIPDSMDGIFTHLKEAALTMQAGGGIGYDFSPLRPKGAEVKGMAADASGPLTFMDVWDAMCRTVMSAGSRRGAMMATMSCEHPDIEEFIEAKRTPGRLRMFNLSVLVTDAFMDAVAKDLPWRLHFEDRHGDTLTEKTIKARDLWDKIMRSTYEFAEPGVIFIDRINRLHNLWYIDDIRATNPCGEKAMGPYDSCLLGSINLARFVKYPFSFGGGAKLIMSELKETVATAIRMMDNVIDINFFPLPQQAKKARETRQLGLGVTGLADMLLMLGIRYGSPEAVNLTKEVMKAICLEAYAESISLAKEKGSFPAFDADKYVPLLGGESFVSTILPGDMQGKIGVHGIRNSLLISIAPTGTISLYAGNVSSGIEPIFAPSYTRKVLQKDGTKTEQLVEDYAIKVWHDQGNEGLPPNYVDAQSLSPADHVHMQATVQGWVDSSISKTINVPEDIPFEDFMGVYELAYFMGCKGCTTYRPNDITGSVLSVEPTPKVEEPVVSSEPIQMEAATWLRGNMEDRKKILRDFLNSHGADTVSKLDKSALPALRALMRDAPEPQPEGGNMIFDNPNGPKNEALWLFPDPDVPEPRPDVLPAMVYKIKAGSMEHAVYVTISDVVDWEGNHRPFEVFIATKDPAHQAWMTALTRMISAVFRRPHDSSFVVEELKAVFDPTFHAFIGGKAVPSLVAAIGGVIERHMKDIGYIESEVKRVTGITQAMMEAESNTGRTPQPGLGDFQKVQRPAMMNPAMVAHYGATVDEAIKGLTHASHALHGPTCQKCFSPNVKNESGCLTCLDCGSSKCG